MENIRKKDNMKDICEITVTEPTQLLAFLYQNIKGKSKNTIKAFLKNGQIEVNRKVQTKFDFPLQKEDVVYIQMRKINSSLSCPILYEDKDLIAILKPSGLLTVSTFNEKENTAYHFVKEYLNQKKQKVFVVHRLDRDTSGIVLFAKNEKMKQLLQNHWNEITIQRGYLAIIIGEMNPQKGIIRTYLKEENNTIVHSVKDPKKGKLAITRYETIKTQKEYSLLEIFLDTGRKNQIRVQMSETGHSIIGDKKYHATKDPLHRLGLHAHILEFIHPITKKVLHLETPIPYEFEKLFLQKKTSDSRHS